MFTYLLPSLTHPNCEACKCCKEIIVCILLITSSESGFWLRISTQTFVDWEMNMWIRIFFKFLLGDKGYRWISSIQFSRWVVSDSATPWTAAHQASLCITNSRSPPKPRSIESVMPFNHLILSRPLLLLPSIFPSIRVFSNESALCIRWPKYWSFSFNISPSNEYPGLISIRIDWLDLLAVQGILKSPLQHHSSQFFSAQLSL